MVWSEHLGLKGSLVAVVGENIPSTKNQVIQDGQWYEILNTGNAILEAFAQAHGSHLGQRTYGKG